MAGNGEPGDVQGRTATCGRAKVRGRRRWLWGLASLSCLALGFVPSGARAEHVIAVVVTEGSVHRPNGDEVLAGAMAAVHRLNAEGGVLGAPLRVTSRAEDCTRQRAVEVAEEIARLKPNVVVGHLCSAAAMAAAPIYAKAGILLIAPGVRHPRLTESENGKLVLRLAGRDDRFAVDAARFIKTHYAGRSVAVIGDRTRQGRGLADGIAAEARRQHIAVALDERIESGERSYGPLAERVRASGAGVVVMPAQPIELGVLVTNLRRAGVEAPIVGSEILAVPAIEAVAREQGRRLVVMLPWTGLEQGSSASFAPDGGAAPDAQREAVRRQGEAAVEVWAAAAKRAGATSPSMVAAAARNAAVPTAVGSLRFDEAGDAIVPGYIACVWLNGAWRPLAD